MHQPDPRMRRRQVLAEVILVERPEVGGLLAGVGERHFVALVSFEGHIDDPVMPAPRVWIFPFAQVERFKRSFPRGRVNVSRAASNSSAAVSSSPRYRPRRPRLPPAQPAPSVPRFPAGGR